MKKEFSTTAALASFFNDTDFHFYYPKEVYELIIFLAVNVDIDIQEINKQHPELQDPVNKLNQYSKN